MTSHIHWLKYIVLILTVFPGIMFFIFDKIAIINKLKTNQKYAVALILVTIVNAIIFNEIIMLLIILGCLIIPYLFEYIINERKKISKYGVLYEIKTLKFPVFVMVICPFFEEYIYRFFIYKHIMPVVDKEWIYILISVLAFLFCHFVTQKEKSVYKIPIAFIECGIFIYTKNVYICIVIHMVYNIMVYAHNFYKYTQN